VEIETPEARNFLDLARAGDTEAFGRICRVYEAPLLRRAMTLCGNATLAEDLAQEVLVEAWKSLHRYNGRCRFFTWLCAILLNRCRISFRKRRFRPAFRFGARDGESDLKSLEQLPDQGFPPDEAAEWVEQKTLVWKCIAALPAKQRQVVYLRFYADDSLEGIAAALGCPVGTVKSRLFHALDRLRGMSTIHAQFADLKKKGGAA